MSNKKTWKIGILVGLVILVTLSLGTIGYMFNKVGEIENVFVHNVYIEDLAVGGLTKEEVRTQLEETIKERINKYKIVLTHDKVSKEVSLSDLGITYNINEILEQAFQVGRDKGLFESYQIAKNGISPEQVFNLTQKIDNSKVEGVIKDCAPAFHIDPVNATLKRVNRQFVTTKEKAGQALDIAATTEKAVTELSALNIFKTDASKEETITIDAVIKSLAPKYTEASLKDSQTLIASFSTNYNDASPNRNANLVVASNKISTMLLPDETFKLSHFLEPFTIEAGYKNAGVIVNGKVQDGIGGGVCQVASTLYNAILLTDLDVTMRQNHSLAVSYVPLGRDATYSTNSIDFRFRNNSGHPIFVEGYCENNKVIINIYGNKAFKSPYDIKFHSQLVETIPAPPTIYKDDATLEEGKENIETTAIDGRRVKLYKLYYQNGVEVKRELVNTSYYRPRAAVIVRGTKKTGQTPQSTPMKQEQTPMSTPESSVPQETPSPTPNGNVDAPTLPETTPDAQEQQPAVDDSFAVEQQ